MLSSLPRTRPAIAALLLGTIVATGCGATAQDDGPMSWFEGQLEAMAGVADARVEREAFDNDYWGEEIVADMDGDATVEDVAAVLDAFLARGRETKGEPQDARVTIGAGTTKTEGDMFAAGAPPLAVPAERSAGNVRVARLLVTAVAAFPGQFVSVTPTDWSVIGTGEGADPRPEIDRMIDVVHADDLLSTAKGLALRAVAGTDNYQRTIQLDAFRGLGPDLVSSWRSFAPHLDMRVFRAAWFGSSSIHLDVRAGENVKPRQLTTEAYGDVLWPTLHPALDTLAAMPSTATLTVVNHYDVDEADGSHREDRFFTTRPRLRPGRDRLGRTWAAEATTYLAGLSRH